MDITLKKSTRPKKKFMVKVENKTIHFGQKGASDFTINKDPERKKRYIDRHSSSGKEDWTKSGIKTAGFWSKHLLWNKDTLTASIKDTEKNFNVDIKYG